MSSAFVEADGLEKGTKANQVPPDVAQADSLEVGQCDNGSEIKDLSSIKSKSLEPEDELEPEHDTGQMGLARLKDFDGRFNFYPAFPEGRSMALDWFAGKISRIVRKVEAQRKKIKGKHHVEPCCLRWGDRDRKRWEKLMTKLWKKVAEYGRAALTTSRLARLTHDSNVDAASVNAKTVNEFEYPRQGAVNALQVWLNKQNNGHRQMYSGRDADAFRMLGPKRGPIERFVHETLPVKTGTAFFLRPFRTRSSKTDDFHFSGYSERTLNRIEGVITLLCICIILVVPLVFLSCFDLNATAKVSIILAMCVLVSLVAHMTEKDEGRQWLLVFAYLATINASLS